MARHLCVCGCHRASAITPFYGADVYDAIEAVTACDSCLRSHCVALLERTIWDEPPLQTTPAPLYEPPPPAVGGCNGDWTGEDGG